MNKSELFVGCTDTVAEVLASALDRCDGWSTEDTVAWIAESLAERFSNDEFFDLKVPFKRYRFLGACNI